ncbi:hypothetical protein Vretimale_11520 [Volvox reticuliferus]|uniref:Uncharacterized protein n=1 Tax=Volvox reticuliferus TaxID=1737510 RepID=A0A8J4GI98_9CHLO|nr:hypothetical protein Vretifemale_14925 [Volvox reticuliferus]GIM07353.1 hypothetical protein Vretimale_11520 [Volvox reticuliferus]
MRYRWPRALTPTSAGGSIGACSTAPADVPPDIVGDVLPDLVRLDPGSDRQCNWQQVEIWPLSCTEAVTAAPPHFDPTRAATPPPPLATPSMGSSSLPDRQLFGTGSTGKLILRRTECPSTLPSAPLLGSLPSCSLLALLLPASAARATSKTT